MVTIAGVVEDADAGTVKIHLIFFKLLAAKLLIFKKLPNKKYKCKNCQKRKKAKNAKNASKCENCQKFKKAKRQNAQT